MKYKIDKYYIKYYIISPVLLQVSYCETFSQFVNVVLLANFREIGLDFAHLLRNNSHMCDIQPMV